ncbi:Virulence factors putative positive transcription regulator BvgA [Photorhabdus australis subsp. thailandensis]|uniref:Virulence factors putative positive transcription regulator BvgA n=1 Tax=Photorhabdus australis subsp. thailandensis TaxID=2805096 RepID=A0A1C0U0E1_9GAMM|nr:helix-turn-helix transcriptional regulator [Photorhabdus australis]OCQ51407.1 Virulence factors putative positive transcription regulator BvgA [Photorhabdus australis subsp. thailandensis]
MSQITPQLTHMWDKSHEPWFVKDKEFRFMYANPVFMKVNQLPENFDVTGCTDKELPTLFNHFTHFFEEHDRKVLQSMQKVSSIGTYLQDDSQQLKSYHCEKYPLMDENNQCIGIICHTREINHFSVYNYIKKDSSISVKLRPPNNILTEKEWVMIFLFCRGISNKSIADEMNISCRTLERYFKNIYEKLSINSMIELRQLCRRNSYDLYIPPEYFQSIGHFLL